VAPVEQTRPSTGMPVSFSVKGSTSSAVHSSMKHLEMKVHSNHLRYPSMTTSPMVSPRPRDNYYYHLTLV
jgi:hypothetical protein